MPLKFIPTNVKYNDSGEFKNISIPADRAYMNEIITISSTQPTNSDNKLWINTNEQTTQAYQIPTMADMVNYRTASAQDAIDTSLTKADEVGIIITGNRPSMAVTTGQYVIVRNSTISGIADGLYIANTALSPSTDVAAANLTTVNGGGLNNLGVYVTENFAPYHQITVTGYNSYKMTLPSLSGHFIFIVSSSLSRSAILYIVVQSNGQVAISEIQKGTNFTYTTDTNEVTFSTGATYAVYIKEIPIRGDPITVEPVE